MVCPLSVMSNWITQFEEHTAGNFEVSWLTDGCFPIAWVEEPHIAKHRGADMNIFHEAGVCRLLTVACCVLFVCLPQVYQFHGPGRNRSPAFLTKQDVVITTYSTLAQELSGGGGGGGLMAVQWLRLVLDEAHCVKNVKSQQARAAAALKAERRQVHPGICFGGPWPRGVDDQGPAILMGTSATVTHSVP